MRSGRPLWVLVLAALIGAVAPAAAYFEETAVDSRSLASGLVAGAVVEGVGAYHWNPAALSRLERSEVLLDYGRPHSVDGLSAYALALGTRARGYGLAFAWHRLAAAEVYAEDLFHLAVGRTVLDGPGGHALAVGAAVKLGRVAVDPFDDPDNPGVRVDYGAATNVAFDLGGLWTTPWKLDLAWVLRDINQPNYELLEGTGGSKVPFRNEVSAAYRWNPESTLLLGWKEVAASGESNLNLGMEIWFFDVFAIRSGLTDVAGIFDSDTPATRFQYAGGVGVRDRRVQVDAAFTTNRDLGASLQVSLSVPLGRGIAP